jgi:hypothetical protein
VPAIKLIAIVGASFLAGILCWNLGLANVLSKDESVVTVNQGISLDDAISAFADEGIKNSLGIKSILVFSKSGGIQDDGQKQGVLRVDLPVVVSANGGVSFQYFVDVRNDLNKQTAIHCGDVRLHVFVDTEEVFVSSWLGYDDRVPEIPLDTGMITIHDFPSGLHKLGLIPEARSGGCNPGYIQSWGGTAILFE